MVTATSKSYAGYHFDDENPGNVASGKVEADGSLVLKLYYKPNPVTLTYKANGGEGADVTVNSFVDETITAADGSAFSRNGYTFAGWNTAADGSGENYLTGGGYKMSAGSNVLYAQWNADPVSPPIGPVTPIVPITPPEPSEPSEPSDPVGPSDPAEPSDPDHSGNSQTGSGPGDTQHNEVKPGKGGSAVSGAEAGSYGNMSNGVPETGDNNDLMMWLLIMMASQIGIEILFFRKNKRLDKLKYR